MSMSPGILLHMPCDLLTMAAVPTALAAFFRSEHPYVRIRSSDLLTVVSRTFQPGYGYGYYHHATYLLPPVPVVPLILPSLALALAVG